jgi:regulator of protease activity HflC (stomatin/prohibitin superfamily)
MKVESVYGEGKTKLLESVFTTVSKEVEKDGILIQKIYIIGSFRLPAEVTAALGSKISAIQKAEQIRNEVEQTKAEASKAIELATGEAQAILLKAKAEAEANGILEKSLTPQVLQYQSLLKWDGKLPQFNGGGAVPFININPSELK